jgi:cytidylate kinase
MTVVTISRQVGSFGDEIAASVAEKLNFRLVGQEEIHDLGSSCDQSFKDACALFEREVPKGFMERFFFHNPAYTSLFESLHFELASLGNVVIVGRGAQIVLSGIPSVLKVRVVAPLKARINRIMDEKHMSAEEAGDYVNSYGHQRRALIESIYHTDLSNWALYDLIINTDILDREAGANIVVVAVRNMAVREDDAQLKQNLKNRAFAKKVESAIKKDVATTPFRNLEVKCPEPGIVVLTGFVHDKSTKEKAESIAAHHAGVTKVENQLRTTGLTF